MSGPDRPPGEVTGLLARVRAGDAAAFDQLFPLVYDDLRARAHRQLARAGPGGTLDTTGLVHEAYLKLVDSASRSWNDRVHFLSVASRAMRQIVVDQARRHLADKRGAGAALLPLDPGRVASPERAAELLALDEAVARLTDLDERLARTVELRYFGGLSVEETAAALGTSPRTVKRDWQKARVLLHSMLVGGPG